MEIRCVVRTPGGAMLISAGGIINHLKQLLQHCSCALQNEKNDCSFYKEIIWVLLTTD